MFCIQFHLRDRELAPQMELAALLQVTAALTQPPLVLSGVLQGSDAQRKQLPAEISCHVTLNCKGS